MSSINGLGETSRDVDSTLECSEDLLLKSSSDPPTSSSTEGNVSDAAIGKAVDRIRTNGHLRQSHTTTPSEPKLEQDIRRQSPPTAASLDIKGNDASAPGLIQSSPSQLHAVPKNGNSPVHPTPLRNGAARPIQASTPSSSSGNQNAKAVPPPTAYGWIPGGSPPHYHPHPMHMYHHPPAMYASPDSSWNKTSGTSTVNSTATGGSATKQQHTPSPAPAIPYPWPPPHHLPPYPYPPPHPHHPYPGSGGNGSRYTQPHLYPWPPPHGPPPSSNRPAPNTPRSSPGSKLTSASSSNVKSPSPTKYKIPGSFGGSTSKVSAKLGAAVESEPVARSDGALSPTEIAIHHRDEIQDMGCTCKKTRCLKLYCQCFGVKLYCGVNCRCLLCHNTRKHEKSRKEAMRNILSRNPAAFDTKFKKDPTAMVVLTSKVTGTPPGKITQSAPPVAVAKSGTEESPLEGVPAKLETIASNAASATDASRALAHRLGCKCRKSACMKKYCECFAANVKCSSSCRCMGCKNMGAPSSDYRDHHAAMGMMAAAAAHQAIQYHRPLPPRIGSANGAMRQYGVTNSNNAGLPPRQTPIQSDTARSSASSNDPWIAAQSLTFLKRGSPGSGGASTAEQTSRSYAMGISPITKSPGMMEPVQENVSMPSLSSSSEGTSPGDCAVFNHNLNALSTPESIKEENNALFLAAVAMTEFGQSPPPTSSMLSPETIQTYNFPVMDNDLSSAGRGNAPHNASSKRSINFDDLPDHEDDNTIKKVKSGEWM